MFDGYGQSRATIEMLEPRQLFSVFYTTQLGGPGNMDPAVDPKTYLQVVDTSEHKIGYNDVGAALQQIENTIDGQGLIVPNGSPTAHFDPDTGQYTYDPVVDPWEEPWKGNVGTDQSQWFDVKNLTFDTGTFCYSASIGLAEVDGDGNKTGVYDYMWGVNLDPRLD